MSSASARGRPAGDDTPSDSVPQLVEDKPSRAIAVQLPRAMQAYARTPIVAVMGFRYDPRVFATSFYRHARDKQTCLGYEVLGLPSPFLCRDVVW